MDRKSPHHVIRYLRSPFLWALVAGGLVVMATFLSSADWELDFFFISDTLYLPSIYRDLFQDGGSLKDWSLNPAPNFFPDMGVYFLLQWLFGDLRWAHYTFPIVQLFAIALCFRGIVRECGLATDERPVAAGLVLLIMVILTGWWGGDFGFAFHLLVNSYHGGAFVNALLCTWLLLRTFGRPGPWPWVLLALATAVGAVSDKLFWVMFPVPAAIVCLVLAARSSAWKRLLGLAVLVGLTTWLAHRGLVNLDRVLPMRIENPYAYLAFERIVFSWSRFLEMLGYYLDGHLLVAGTIVLGLVVMVWLIVRAVRLFVQWLRTPRTGQAGDERALLVTWMAALFCPFVLLAPVANGSFDGLDSLRYDFAVFALAPLVAGLALGRWLARSARVWVPVAILVVGLPALWVCISAGTDGYRRLGSHKPEVVRAFDQLPANLGLRNGVANYWVAKRIMMFAERRVMVLPVHPGVGMYVHVNRPGMFLDSVFNFVILEPDELIREDMVRIFRQDTGFHVLGGREVMHTAPWRFDPVMEKPAIPAE